MVVRNEEKYITEAIQSILDQTFSNFEFIIVDDNSTDRTKEIISSFHDPRIRLFDNPNNPGKPGGLNFGYAQARGKYIAHMDGDDISLPNRFHLLYEFMESHPEIGVCGGKMLVFGENYKTWEFIPATSHDEIVCDPFGISIGYATTLLRISSIPSFIKYKDEYHGAEDLKFYSDLSPYARFANIESCVYHYRRHSEQISTKHKDLQKSLTFKVAADNFQKRYEDLEIEGVPQFVKFLRGEINTVKLSELILAFELAQFNPEKNHKMIRGFIKDNIEGIRIDLGSFTKLQFTLIWVRYKTKSFVKRFFPT